MVLVTVDNPYPKCTTFTAVTNPLDETHPDVMQYNLMKAQKYNWRFEGRNDRRLRRRRSCLYYNIIW